MSRQAKTGLLLATAAVILSGCGGSSSASRTTVLGGRDIKGDTILFLINSPPDSPWGPALNAVKAVEATTGIKVRVVYGSTDSQIIAEIQAGIATHVAGMALDIPMPAADTAICAASDGGIPVVAWNTNGYGPAAKRCVLAYMGQNFLTAGHEIASYLAVRGYIKRGAHVYCPVEDATSAYAKLRAQGVNSVLASFGARCDVQGVGYGLVNQASIIDYLQRHPRTNLVIALGDTPFANLPAALNRLRRHIPVAGFDISDSSTSRIIEGIQAGTIVAAVDQELYSEAFQAVMQLALYMKYGLFPSNVDTSNHSVIDNTDAGLAASLSGAYR